MADLQLSKAKSALKSPSTYKRPADPKRVTFLSPKPGSPKQPRLLFGTSNLTSSDLSPQNLKHSKTSASSDNFNKEATEVEKPALPEEMKAIALREQNWWQIVCVVAKTKAAIVQVTDEDRLLSQVDIRLKDCKAKLANNVERAKERVKEVESIRKSGAELRDKFDALRFKAPDNLNC